MLTLEMLEELEVFLYDYSDDFLSSLMEWSKDGKELYPNESKSMRRFVQIMSAMAKEIEMIKREENKR